MIREELLALADELEAFDGYTCERCAAYEQPECRAYIPCTGVVSKYCARLIREAVERDGEGATTVSAYDLLPDEDRKAIAWVREHGGLGAVEKRLMPEGMEWLLEVWPKWSNGEYCKFGDWWKAGKYGKLEPQQLSRLAFFTPEQLREWGQDEGENFGYEWNFMRPSDTTYRPDKAEPPAPKVLAADGEPLEVGQTVWRIDTGAEYFVKRGKTITADAVVIIRKTDCDCENEIVEASQLTHQRPVLDADGVPCREGDEVWEVRSHRRREIVGTNYCDHRTGEPLILCDGDDAIPIPATCVTHTKPEQPDTWELLEEDARQLDIYLNDTTDDYPRMSCCRDIVRRCRALAEKENRNE